ncbi:MAG: hypothetical protein HY552_04775 [Elusimicrobia bacterium]|nr:hypothetical protein [Elusimicrobiota bacterium]
MSRPLVIHFRIARLTLVAFLSSLPGPQAAWAQRMSEAAAPVEAMAPVSLGAEVFAAPAAALDLGALPVFPASAYQILFAAPGAAPAALETAASAIPLTQAMRPASARRTARDLGRAAREATSISGTATRNPARAKTKSDRSFDAARAAEKAPPATVAETAAAAGGGAAPRAAELARPDGRTTAVRAASPIVRWTRRALQNPRAWAPAAVFAVAAVSWLLQHFGVLPDSVAHGLQLASLLPIGPWGENIKNLLAAQMDDLADFEVRRWEKGGDGGDDDDGKELAAYHKSLARSVAKAPARKPAARELARPGHEGGALLAPEQAQAARQTLGPNAARAALKDRFGGGRSFDLPAALDAGRSRGWNEEEARQALRELAARGELALLPGNRYVYAGNAARANNAVAPAVRKLNQGRLNDVMTAVALFDRALNQARNKGADQTAQDELHSLRANAVLKLALGFARQNPALSEQGKPKARRRAEYLVGLLADVYWDGAALNRTPTWDDARALLRAVGERKPRSEKRGRSLQLLKTFLTLAPWAKEPDWTPAGLTAVPAGALPAGEAVNRYARGLDRGEILNLNELLDIGRREGQSRDWTMAAIAELIDSGRLAQLSDGLYLHAGLAETDQDPLDGRVRAAMRAISGAKDMPPIAPLARAAADLAKARPAASPAGLWKFDGAYFNLLVELARDVVRQELRNVRGVGDDARQNGLEALHEGLLRIQYQQPNWNVNWNAELRDQTLRLVRKYRLEPARHVPSADEVSAGLAALEAFLAGSRPVSEAERVPDLTSMKRAAPRPADRAGEDLVEIVKGRYYLRSTINLKNGPWTRPGLIRIRAEASRALVLFRRGDADSLAEAAVLFEDAGLRLHALEHEAPESLGETIPPLEQELELFRLNTLLELARRLVQEWAREAEDTSHARAVKRWAQNRLLEDVYAYSTADGAWNLTRTLEQKDRRRISKLSDLLENELELKVDWYGEADNRIRGLHRLNHFLRELEIGQAPPVSAQPHPQDALVLPPGLPPPSLN